jgi:hypothetical protein
VARIVLFHHAQGLRDDVLTWAESLVLEDGIAHRDEVGTR